MGHSIKDMGAIGNSVQVCTYADRPVVCVSYFPWTHLGVAFGVEGMDNVEVWVLWINTSCSAT